MRSPFACLAALILCCLALSSCGDRDARAQQAADLRAGVRALRAAYEAGAATADVLAILQGIDSRLPAVSGVNSAEWPAPTWTPQRIAQDPRGYAASAPPEPSRWSFAAVVSGAALGSLALLRVVAPLIPGGGPLVKAGADLLWNLAATRDQKATDNAKAQLAATAEVLIPLAAELREQSKHGTLPDGVARLLENPHVVAALHDLTTAKTTA